MKYLPPVRVPQKPSSKKLASKKFSNLANSNLKEKKTFVGYDDKSYEYSISEKGEVDGYEEYCSDEEPPEPTAECTHLIRLNTTGTISRAAI